MSSETLRLVATSPLRTLNAESRVSKLPEVLPCHWHRPERLCLNEQPNKHSSAGIKNERSIKTHFELMILIYVACDLRVKQQQP